MNVYLQYVLVFLAMMLTDAAWAYYTASVAAKWKLSASIASAAIVVIGCVTLILFINDYWLLIPEAAGAFAGTYLSMWWQEGLHE